MTVWLGSITDLSETHRGQIVIAGSHGAAATGRHALHFGVRALVCHDASIGMEDAGVAALDCLEASGIPAAAVAHVSARIGDPADMFERGVLSRVNSSARSLGVEIGQAVKLAVMLLEKGPPAAQPAPRPDENTEVFARRDITPDAGGHIVLLDSASTIALRDDDAVVITGSHGGLPGNQGDRALRAKPLFVAFNDAGVGIDGAGTGRLPVLEAQGIAAVCVGAATARIGDSHSTYLTGVITHANQPARELGAQPGQKLAPLAEAIAARPLPSAFKSKVTP